jgi:hypothetical protein
VGVVVLFEEMKHRYVEMAVGLGGPERRGGPGVDDRLRVVLCAGGVSFVSNRFLPELNSCRMRSSCWSGLRRRSP